MEPWATVTLAALGGIFLDISLAKISKENRIGKRRIHHSLLGIPCILLGLFMIPVALITLGITIIVSHTIRSKKFVFIERKSKK